MLKYKIIFTENLKSYMALVTLAFILISPIFKFRLGVFSQSVQAMNGLDTQAFPIIAV